MWSVWVCYVVVCMVCEWMCVWCICMCSVFGCVCVCVCGAKLSTGSRPEEFALYGIHECMSTERALG